MRIRVRFYEELNEFLPAHRRKRTFPVEVGSDEPLSAMLRSLGVPPNAVELVLGDRGPVGLEYRPAPGERLAFYPVFETLDLSPLLAGRTRRRLAFALSPELTGLARCLRLLGFSAEDEGPDSGRGGAGSPVLLTREPARLEDVSRGYRVRSRRPRDQAVEVVRRFDLSALVRPLTRCPSCGRELPAAPAPCPGCGRRAGSARQRLREHRLVEAILRRAGRSAGTEAPVELPPGPARGHAAGRRRAAAVEGEEDRRMTKKTSKLLERMAEWPQSWVIGEGDVGKGEEIVDELRRFAQTLVDRRLAETTIRRHLNHLWLLGGDLIARTHLYPAERRKSALELLNDAVDAEGGPLSKHLATERDQRAFDATCRKLHAFLAGDGVGKGSKGPAR